MIWLLASALLFSAALMLALWSYEVRHNDAGIVDVGWSLGMGLAALLYAVCANTAILPRAAVVGESAVELPWWWTPGAGGRRGGRQWAR